MTQWQTFDVDIEREVRLDAMVWPNEAQARREGWFGGNRMYCPLIGMPWSEVEQTLELEGEIIDRIASASDSAEEEGIIEDEMYESCDDGLYGLDIGIASSVVALSAAGCVPFSSCNGGVFGRSHREEYPLVALYARKSAVPLLLECAGTAGVGLTNGDEGELVLHGATLESLRLFAETVLKKADQFDALHSSGG